MATETRDPLEATLDLSGFDNPGPLQHAPAVVGPQPVSMGMAEFVVAQRIPSPRNYEKVVNRLKTLAAAAGEKWYYGWDVNDRKNNRKVHIEGPTIKLANDLWREFGNCVVDVRVMDQGASWIFYARFIDLESGANMTRAYQQRKGQDVGMADQQRALDMVLQIGQSKAIRNVVVNALQTLSTFCVEEAKKSTIKKIAEKPEDARKFIIDSLEAMGIERKRVEAIYGRTSNNWTVPDMAKIYAEMRGIADEMIQADDVWPQQEVDAKPAKDEDKASAKEKTESDKKPKPEPKGKAGSEAGQKFAGPKDDAPPATGTTPSPDPVQPKVTMHVFDDKKRSLGSMTATLLELGQEISLADGTYKVFECMEHPGGDGYMIVVSRVLGESSPPQTGEGASPAAADHGSVPSSEAGGQSQSAGRPKRLRRTGGTLFGNK